MLVAKSSFDEKCFIFEMFHVKQAQLQSKHLLKQ